MTQLTEPRRTQQMEFYPGHAQAPQRTMQSLLANPHSELLPSNKHMGDALASVTLLCSLTVAGSWHLEQGGLMGLSRVLCGLGVCGTWLLFSESNSSGKALVPMFPLSEPEYLWDALPSSPLPSHQHKLTLG